MEMKINKSIRNNVIISGEIIVCGAPEQSIGLQYGSWENVMAQLIEEFSAILLQC